MILVKWNEPYQKLASCDSSGIIFVWIKYEGRWSIELINDRNTPVTHFSWSHDGRMALICYQDGFVLVGSVAGQRYWSSMLNLESTITCGIWTPDDQQVYFGTTQGQIIVVISIRNLYKKKSFKIFNQFIFVISDEPQRKYDLTGEFCHQRVLNFIQLLTE